VGLDNSGKTSILHLLNRRYSLMGSIKPTFKAKRSAKDLSLLGLRISNWDLGGQRSFREQYLQNKAKYFSEAQTIFYVIDIQCPERFDEALTYLKEIVNTTEELGLQNPKFIILYHKFDPDLREDKEIQENVYRLGQKISESCEGIDFNSYKTSIYDEANLLKAFSDGVISISHKAQLMQNLLKEYMAKSFNSATLLLDQNCFIIASRATQDSYQDMCVAIAPRLINSIEKLEEWQITTIDIVTNIEFPLENQDGTREGLIFLRKLDLRNERLYLISLCLNKRVKVKSYEYIPILAENLKNLLKKFD